MLGRHVRVGGVGTGVAFMLVMAVTVVSHLSARSAPIARARPVMAASGTIAFERLVDGRPWITLVGDDGSIPQSTLPGSHPSWSPDGTRIAYMEGARIKTANANGRQAQTLTSTFSYQPDWSPSGGLIAFTDQRAGSDDIWVMAADGSAQARLTDSPRLDYDPAWSPDGTRIAYAAATPDPAEDNVDIWVMRADGSDRIRLTTDRALDRAPAWSPDGRRIAFASNRVPGTGACTFCNAEIYVTDLAGSGQARVTWLPASVETDPTWSADGTRIAFSSDVGGDEEIVVVDLATGALANLTNDPSEDSSPDWRVSALDQTPPVLEVPRDLVVEETTDGAAVVRYRAAATDAVDPAPVVSCDPRLGLFPVGTTTVTCTATDVSGNRSTRSFSVRVIVPGRPRLTRDPRPPTVSRSSTAVSVGVRVRVSHRATLRLGARNPRTGAALTLLKGTRLGSNSLPAAMRVAVSMVPVASVVPLRVVLAPQQVLRGRAYDLVLTARGVTGLSDELVVHFRG